VPFTVPLDRTLALACQKAFGRLRGLLRHQPVPLVDVIAQARECGRAAHAAEMRLDMMVDVLTGLPMADTARVRSVQESLIHAAVEAYLVAGERQTDPIGA
jgi:hypothetical protein